MSDEGNISQGHELFEQVVMVTLQAKDTATWLRMLEDLEVRAMKSSYKIHLHVNELKKNLLNNRYKKNKKHVTNLPFLRLTK